jgi:hypothetical protein
MSNAASASPDSNPDSKEAVGCVAGNNGTAVIGCTDDDAKQMETGAAGVEVVAAAADNETVDAAPNAEER